jgi:lipid A 3-O-deacylase
MNAHAVALAAALAAAAAAAGPGYAADGAGRGSLALLVENDSLASGTDRNYTSGVQLTWRAGYEEAPGFLRALGRGLGDLADLKPQSFGASLGHVIFTPEDITLARAPPDDRPYAAMVYAKAGFAAQTGDRLDTIELTVGLVGPSAQGEWIQTNLHSLVSARDPKGWDAQLGDEVVFALDLERRWRVPLGPRDRALSADLIPTLGLTLGTLRTEAGAGVAVRFGAGLDNDFGPPRIRPSLAGGGLVRTRPGLRIYGFAGVYGRLVAHDLFLDGNTWRRSASVTREPAVGDIQAGLAAQWGGLSLAFTQVVRTREFRGQRSDQQFGALTLLCSW